MARGWESKSVEAQQADREQRDKPAPQLSVEQTGQAARRKTIELTLARAQADLGLAKSAAHRTMLEAAIAALRDQLARIVPVVLLLLVSACSIRDAACGKPTPDAGTPFDPGGPAAASAAAAGEARIAFLGDSLTAGLGLLAQQAYPAQIQELFAAEGYEVEAVNAGISGDTTAGGLRRVDQLLDPQTKVIVVALGANDALRGLTIQQTYDNLSQIIERSFAQGKWVVLCGMEGPTNLGADYRDAFREVYINLLRQYQGKIVFVPFLLEGVAGDPALNQADGVHPTPEGARKIAEAIYPKVKQAYERAGGG